MRLIIFSIILLVSVITIGSLMSSKISNYSDISNYSVDNVIEYHIEQDGVLVIPITKQLTPIELKVQTTTEVEDIQFIIEVDSSYCWGNQSIFQKL